MPGMRLRAHPGMTSRRALRHPQKIALADLDAIVAQDAVRGGGVEEEVRKHRAVDIVWPGKVMVLVGPTGNVTSLVSAPSNCAGLNVFR